MYTLRYAYITIVGAFFRDLSKYSVVSWGILRGRLKVVFGLGRFGIVHVKERCRPFSRWLTWNLSILYHFRVKQPINHYRKVLSRLIFRILCRMAVKYTAGSRYLPRVQSRYYMFKDKTDR